MKTRIDIAKEAFNRKISIFYQVSCTYGKISDIEILKAASSKYLLNVISGQNDPMYKLLPTSVIWTPRSTAQAKQQTKIQDFKNQELQ